MKRTIKGAMSFILIIAIVLSSFVFTSTAAGRTYSTSSNSGERDELCTSLSNTGYEDYYTGQYTYENLSELSSSSLLSTLRTLMASTHKKITSYADCKNYADKTDCENNDGRVLLLYTSYSAAKGDFISGSTGWNREHVWPQSLGGFGTSRAGSDLHHIRPDDSKTNGDRGNNKYGYVSGGKVTTSNLGNISGGTYGGGLFEPHDNVKGDVARICLYVYVRWGGEYSSCSSITNVFESVETLLEWCALDPVDTWEMGRNVVVENIQGNRNVFIDYPELAWAIFGKTAPSGMTTPSNNANNGNGGNGGGDNGGGNQGGGTTCHHADKYTVNYYDSDCSAEGYTGDTYCRDCGEKISTGTAIPMKAHTWSEWIYDSSMGVKWHFCEVCEKEELVNTGDPVIPPEECKHTITTVRDKLSPTCSAEGYTGNTYCVSCGEKLSTGTAISATGVHEYGELTVTKAPTKTSEGEAVRTCRHCTDSITEVLPRLASTREEIAELIKSYSRDKDVQMVIYIFLGYSNFVVFDSAL